jgi:phosphate uptake regulator
MKRKLIQLSPSTAVVSLPSTWIRQNSLKKGEEVNVEEIENRIMVSTERKATDKEITIDISKLKAKIMWGSIAAAYVAGYDSIIILTKDQKQKEFMSKVVRYFPGMMIFEERKNKVHFKDITKGAKEDVDKILNRIFNMNISLMEDALEAVKAENWTTLADMKRRDWTINSYIEYCLRQLNKFGYTQYSKTGLMNTYTKEAHGSLQGSAGNTDQLQH